MMKYENGPLWKVSLFI